VSVPATPSGILRRALFQLRLFFIALQFFTRLPIPAWVGFESHWLHLASRYFPAVGIVVGAAAALVFLAADAVLPTLPAVLLSTAAGIYLTGAFHEDGFADTCDGLGGGTTRDRVLEIMTDSRIGTYGALGIGLLLAAKVAALAHLPAQLVAPVLVAAHPLSRLLSTALIWKLDYVKGSGKAKPLAQRISNGEFAIALGSVALTVAALVAAGLLAWQALVAGLIAAALAAAWLARKCVLRIGGYTGDCLGAVQQLSEAAFYIGVLALVT